MLLLHIEALACGDHDVEGEGDVDMLVRAVFETEGDGVFKIVTVSTDDAENTVVADTVEQAEPV